MCHGGGTGSSSCGGLARLIDIEQCGTLPPRACACCKWILLLGTYGKLANATTLYTPLSHQRQSPLVHHHSRQGEPSDSAQCDNLWCLSLYTDSTCRTPLLGYASSCRTLLLGYASSCRTPLLGYASSSRLPALTLVALIFAHSIITSRRIRDPKALSCASSSIRRT